MDEVGVYANLLFPNVGGSRQYLNIARNEPDLALECCRAYNDFLTEWCSADPNRLLAQVSLPLWDLDACVTEIERNAAAGHKSVMMTYQPDGYDLPWLADPHWDPIWNATQDAGLPITFHIDAGREMNVWPDYDSATHLVKLTIMSFLGNTDAISEVIFSGLCHRYPDLDFVSVESGIGYIPYLLESMDWQWINLGLDKVHPERDLLPSEYFHRQVYGSFWFEQDSALRIIDLIQDNVMYGDRFPAPDQHHAGRVRVLGDGQRKPRPQVRQLGYLRRDPAEGPARQRGAGLQPRLVRRGRRARVLPRSAPPHRRGSRH